MQDGTILRQTVACLCLSRRRIRSGRELPLPLHRLMVEAFGTKRLIRVVKGWVAGMVVPGFVIEFELSGGPLSTVPTYYGANSVYLFVEKEAFRLAQFRSRYDVEVPVEPFGTAGAEVICISRLEKSDELLCDFLVGSPVEVDLFATIRVRTPWIVIPLLNVIWRNSAFHRRGVMGHLCPKPQVIIFNLCHDNISLEAPIRPIQS